jgi:cyclase
MVRVLAKLDVKPPMVVKPVHYEGLRKIGKPQELAEKYYLQGADEILYLDIVASLYQREILYPYIENTADKIFVPFAVGGGVRNLDDFSKLFHAGADKVVINTYALQNDYSIIEEAAKVFGSQSVVVNIEAKRKRNDWLCYSDCGRMTSEWSVTEWSKKIEELGAGEILLQSVDMDGRRRGFDLELVGEVVNAVNIPVIAASGAGTKESVFEVIKEAAPSAVAVSSLLHYEISTISDLKTYLKEQGIEVNL